MTSPPAFCFHLTMGREELYNLERPESCSSLPHPPVIRGAEKRNSLPGTGLDFMNVGGEEGKSGPQKLCDMHKNAAKNLSEIFWSAGRILALFLRVFPVSMVLCCRVRACAGSRFGAIPPPFHPKSGKRSGGRYRSRDQGVDFCEKARLFRAAAVRKTAQLCQKTKKAPTKRSVLFC